MSNASSSPRTGSVPAPSSSSPSSGLGRSGLFATLSALFLSVVSFAAAGIAVPDIGASLQATAAEQSLVVAIYALGFAVPLVLGGRLGDLYGRRRLFLIGMAGFTLFSLLATFAPTMAVLIIARALMGISAAAMVPQVLATITASTQGRERARAVAWFGATAGGATAVGQILGGVLVSIPLLGAGWRTVFAASVVMGALSFLAALRWMPSTSAPGRRSLDLIGTALVGAAMLSLLVPLSQGSGLGWPVWCWALLIAAPVLFAAFWGWQHRVHRSEKTPLIPPSLFHLLSYRVGILMALMLQSAYGAFTFVYALTAQTGLGWTPMHTALVLLPFALCFFGVSVLSGKLATKFGFRRMLIVGGIIQAVLLAVTATSILLQRPELNSWTFAALLVGVGVGQALMFGPLVGAMVADVPPAIAGAASGVLQTVQQASMGLGVAIAGGLLSAAVSGATTTTAGTYISALAICMIVQAAFAITFALCALALPRR